MKTITAFLLERQSKLVINLFWQLSEGHRESGKVMKKLALMTRMMGQGFGLGLKTQRWSEISSFPHHPRTCADIQSLAPSSPTESAIYQDLQLIQKHIKI